MTAYNNTYNSMDTAPSWAAVVFQQLGFKYQSTTETISQCEFVCENHLKDMGMALVSPILETLWENEGDVWDKY